MPGGMHSELHSMLHGCSSLYNRLQALQRFATPPPNAENYGMRLARTMDHDYTHARRGTCGTCGVRSHAGHVRPTLSANKKPMSCCRFKTMMEHWQFGEKKRLTAMSFHKI
jgi:hypothetical protein